MLGWDLMHNVECRALMFAAGARSTLFISILFLSTALLQYANEAAGEFGRKCAAVVEG